MVSAMPIVNRNDKKRLQPYLAESNLPTAHRVRQLLERARAVGPLRVPPDLVTMNSHLLVHDPRDDSTESYVLAYPDHLDMPGVTVSVLSPLGSALLGARIGDEVTYPGARGMRKVLIENLVYQPERSGDLDL